jgi:hypothetical protein
VSDSFDLQRFVNAQAPVYRRSSRNCRADESGHIGCGSSFRRSPVSASARWRNAGATDAEIEHARSCLVGSSSHG